MVNDTQTDADEVDAFNAMDDELLTARQDFMMVAGKRDNPIDLNYSFRNGGYEWSVQQFHFEARHRQKAKKLGV